ncbi:hypothetical protein D1BOALGB6SA_10366 [Olavius sp. associated proteobacterium Delta 1]|nr:hypothetical protein D1BOALGB6SA_10366 [Olavius sp. associated proteobacterium Delta 1]
MSGGCQKIVIFNNDKCQKKLKMHTILLIYDLLKYDKIMHGAIQKL